MTWMQALKLLAEALFASYSPFVNYPEDVATND